MKGSQINKKYIFTETKIIRVEGGFSTAPYSDSTPLEITSEKFDALDKGFKELMRN